MKDLIYNSTTTQKYMEKKMLNELYTLDVISHLPGSNGKKLKKYALGGVDTVGAYGNEPFEVNFKNNSWQRVQVRLSIDGTDVLTGKLADTVLPGEMWLVEPYGTLALKAWPETNKGGAQFIFTSADKSVAVNTHGDLSSRGVIAAAVYVEGYTAPIWIGGGDWKCGGGIGGGYSFGEYNTGDFVGSLGTNSICADVQDYSTTSIYNVSQNAEHTKSLKSLAAVGAGQHVAQKIEKVTGLIQPTLSQIIKVKYLWWDDLVSQAKATNVRPTPGSGFPGDEVRMMSIGSTPRLGNWSPPLLPRVEFTRF